MQGESGHAGNLQGAGHDTGRHPGQVRFVPGTEVEFVVEDDTVKLVRATQAGNTRGDRVVRRLLGRAVSRLTTDEILALTRGP